MTEDHQTANLRVEKRVLVVVNHPLGGIRTYLLGNLPQVAQAGYVFTFMAPKGRAFEELKTDVQDWPGVEFIDIPIRNRQHSIVKAVWRALKTRRFHLIHSQGLRGGAETALANLRFRVPHIITLHDTRNDSDFRGRLALLKRKLVERVSITANKIIAVSNDCLENHLDFFPHWKKHRERLSVVFNGVDVANLQLSAEAAANDSCSRLKIRDRPFVLGYFGRFMPEKGFPVLLDALRMLADQGYQQKIRLIATDDPNGYGREYRKIVEADAALREMVQFMPPVTEIGTILAHVDAVVMPSLREACPLLPMEAMVLGIPVIGSDAIGLREVLRGTPAKTPPAGDARALADAICSAMDPTNLQAARAYRAEAIRRFDLRESAQKLSDVYESVANS